MKTDDLRIVKTHSLLSPAILIEEIPLTDVASTNVCEARRAIEAILEGTGRHSMLAFAEAIGARAVKSSAKAANINSPADLAALEQGHGI